MSTASFRIPASSLALALLVEGALLASAALVLVNSAAPIPALSAPVPLTLLAPEPEPPLPEPAPKSKPLPPQVMPKPQVVPKVKTAVAKPQTTPPTPTPTPVAEPTPLAAAPSAFSEPVHATTPPPAPASSGKPDPNGEYAAKVRAAVQAAVVYPPAAASLRFSGRVRVEFHLRDAVPAQARVVIASGIGMIDRAALQSVQSAGYPAPAADMQGRDLVYQVWVDFIR